MPPSISFKRVFLSLLYVKMIAVGMLALPGSLMAEVPFSTNETNKYLVTHWQTGDDLPENLVNSIAQTPDGYLWVGTFGGLARFDGLKFVTFGVHNTDAFANNRIVNLYVDRSGNLWIQPDFGNLVRFHRGRFTKYTMEQGFRNDQLTGMAEDALGNLWIGDNQGIERWQNGKFVVDDCGKQLGKQSVQSIISGRDGVWITTATGVYVIKNEKLSSYLMPESVSRLGTITRVQEDATGHLWVFGSGFATRFSLRELPKEREEAEPFFRDEVSSFCEGSNGDFWLGTEQHGLYHWRESQGTNFDKVHAISDGQIRTIYEDREQNIWVGTMSGGLYRVRRPTIEILPVAASASDQDTLAVAEDSARHLWVGTVHAGLFRGTLGQFPCFSQEHGAYNSSPIWSLCPARDGSLWVGTWDNGLYRIRNNSVSRFDEKNGLSDHEIQSIYEDKDGSIWAGTFNGGLDHFDGQRFEAYGTKEGLEGKYITCILRAADGTLWVGSDGWGVYQQVGGKFILYSTKDGLLSNIVLAMYQDAEGHLWVGTQGGGGLNRWCGDRFVGIRRESGLPVDSIKEILEDDEGNLWLGSNRGIVRASKSELNDLVDGKISRLHVAVYGRSDGLNNMECRGGTQPAACKTSDGNLYFATHEGLVKIDPRQISSNRQPPAVMIEEVLVDGRPVWPSYQKDAAGRNSRTFDVQLLPGERECEFRYTSPSLAEPEKVQFKYRLEGLDANWTEAGTQRSCLYKYLPPGKYRFQVIACNENGIWNETGASLTLYRPPRYWQTNWFLALVSLAAAAAIGGAARWLTKRRTQRQLEELQRKHTLERERIRIARDIHDDLGASLTKISKVTEAMDWQIDTHDQNRPLVETIADTANEAILAIDEIVWTINPQNDSLSGVANYLIRFTEEFLRPVGISYDLDVPLAIPNVAVSADIRHNLLMVVKEALNNAVKHASPKRIRLTLKLSGDVLTVEVADDGIGMPPENERRSGTGLAGMRKRLASMGGELYFFSQPGRGTTVQVKIRLHNEPADTQNLSS